MAASGRNINNGNETTGKICDDFYRKIKLSSKSKQSQIYCRKIATLTRDLSLDDFFSHTYFKIGTNSF